MTHDLVRKVYNFSGSCANYQYSVFQLELSRNLLFRRNSVTGAVEVVARDGQGIALNEDLHAN